jgi:phosphonate transport system substrate-binding protein
VSATDLLSVCPHDTAKNLVGWFFINTYLQRRLGCGIHFEPKDNFIKEREAVLGGGYRIVYANPYSAAIFKKNLGFIPVARPSGVFDETVLVCAAEADIPQHRPIKIASATDKLIVHALGLTLLERFQLTQADCEFQFAGNHMAAAQAVLQGKADLGFIYNETWNGMADHTRKGLRELAQTESRRAYHCFCIAPEWRDKLDQIREILCSMHQSEAGLRILQDLHFTSFEPADEKDIDEILAMI